MSPTRRLALRLLRVVVRNASSDSRDWADAMLRELDFIESDWAALFWALGSTTAIFRHSVPRELRTWFGRHSNQEEGVILKHIRKNAAGTASGVVIAVGVLVSAFGLVRVVGGHASRARYGPCYYPLRRTDGHPGCWF